MHLSSGNVMATGHVVVYMPGLLTNVLRELNVGTLEQYVGIGIPFEKESLPLLRKLAIGFLRKPHAYIATRPLTIR